MIIKITVGSTIKKSNSAEQLILEIRLINYHENLW
jgi:hypothetical protein